MIYYIRRYTGASKDAGTKAPKDIYSICNQMGWKEILFEEPQKGNNIIINLIQKVWINRKNWKNLLKKAIAGDVVIYQHPMYFGAKFAMSFIPKLQKRGVSFIALIHDLESLRNLTSTGNKDVSSYKYADLVLLNLFDKIIAHNQYMKKYLEDKGFSIEKIICLDIFDYLCETDWVDNSTANSIAIAGNLDKKKCGYIYEFAENNPNLIINVYGAHFDEESRESNLKYAGSFSPEKITGVLDGAYGLVWDGPTAKTCTGKTGEYLKYNNPHKTSMYLAAGIPVIVWKYAAIADFVLRNNVGITVESLINLESVLNQVNEQDYLQMKNNAKKIGIKLRNGEFFKLAMDKAIE